MQKYFTTTGMRILYNLCCFSLVGIGAIVTTAFACIFIFAQIVLDGSHLIEPVKHDPHGFRSFFLAFGTILFAFGGASTFPTIQNDMVQKNKFSVSVVIGFSVILILSLPVAAAGYFVYGEAVNSNIVLSVKNTSLVMAANMLLAMHLVLAFIIIINPVCQELEEIFEVPHKFHWKRCLVRTGMVCVMVLVGESIPEFGKILSLVGGSTITLLTFVFPSFFYMRLCDQEKQQNWPDRNIPAYIRVYLWELILIGFVGGSASTYSAILEIFGEYSVTKPCFFN
ncbi:amino acid transporter AVT1A-like [Zootermopsis nevadensis]|uniref:amino acid transporter AVT1A-like n=1 Tax=Zootermopsis nevadensis TaxID=136037 RepID=UPI000B8E3675|nr:amino acid transporter AVT1A-like [Zootermopsis nevadensis]